MDALGSDGHNFNPDADAPSHRMRFPAWRSSNLCPRACTLGRMSTQRPRHAQVPSFFGSRTLERHPGQCVAGCAGDAHGVDATGSDGVRATRRGRRLPRSRSIVQRKVFVCTAQYCAGSAPFRQKKSMNLIAMMAIAPTLRDNLCLNSFVSEGNSNSAVDHVMEGSR